MNKNIAIYWRQQGISWSLGSVTNFAETILMNIPSYL